MKLLKKFNESWFGKDTTVDDVDPETIAKYSTHLEDDDLGNLILNKIKNLDFEVTGFYDAAGGQLKSVIDGDDFIAAPGGLFINGEKLECSKSISRKFWDLFKIAKQNTKSVSRNSVIDKLRDKYAR